jgi:AMMECR1 domain-containing protein
MRGQGSVRNMVMEYDWLQKEVHKMLIENDWLNNLMDKEENKVTSFSDQVWYCSRKLGHPVFLVLSAGMRT